MIKTLGHWRIPVECQDTQSEPGVCVKETGCRVKRPQIANDSPPLLQKVGCNFLIQMLPSLYTCMYTVCLLSDLSYCCFYNSFLANSYLFLGSGDQRKRVMGCEICAGHVCKREVAGIGLGEGGSLGRLLGAGDVSNGCGYQHCPPPPAWGQGLPQASGPGESIHRSII